MTLSRREMIALMLGVPALSLGCSGASLPSIEGELLGQSFEIGHRLRDGYRPRPTDDQWQDVPIVIVGAGAAGLSAAWKLQQSGHTNFVVLELESVFGGTSRSGSSSLTPFPWGAHYVPVPLGHNKNLINLLSEMGVVESLADDGSPVIGEQYLCRDPEERLFYQGEWIEGLYPATNSNPADQAQLERFQQEVDRWVIWRDASGRRAFSIPTSQASDDPIVMELDRISMSEWLRKQGFDSPRLHWLVDYSCRDDYGLTADETSAWAGLLYFAGRLKTAGAEHQPMMTWPEGNGHLMNFLANNVGSRLKVGHAVSQIAPVSSDSGDRIEVSYFDTKTQQVGGIRASHVIFAAPQFLAPLLIDGYFERTRRKTIDFEYGSWFVANLHLRDRPKERHFPLCWDNVIHDSPSLGYVVATHQSGRDHGPTVLTWYYPLCDSNARAKREFLFRATWQELADIVLTDLERPHPDLRSLITRLDIFRWGHAMIQPRPGFISNPERKAASRPDGRIHFANTDLSGIALFEEAFEHGCRAADEVIASIAQPSTRS